VKRIVRNKQDWELLHDIVSPFIGKKPFSVELSSTIKRRTVEQNSYYWGVIVQKQLEYYESNMEDMIRDVLYGLKFALTTEFVHELNKIIYFNGRSTREKDTVEFSKICDQIREHFLHDFKFLIEGPNEQEGN